MSPNFHLPHNVVVRAVYAMLSNKNVQLSVLSSSLVISLLCLRFPWIAPPLLRSTFYTIRSPTSRNILLAGLFCSYLTSRLSKRRSPWYSPPVFVLLSWVLYYKFKVVEMPILRFQRNFWNVHITERSHLSKKRFHVTPWAWNRHAQTITCFIVTHLEWLWSVPIRYHRETIPAGDAGNVLFVDWAYCAHADEDHWWQRSKEGKNASYNDDVPDTHSSDQPIVIAVPGLGDDRTHPYLQRLVRECSESGWRVVIHSYWRLDFMNCEDLRRVVHYVHRRNPNAPIIGVGYSAGGHVMLRYLQEIGKETPLIAAIGVSACFDFVQAVRDVEANENTTYRLFLDNQLRVCARRHLANDNSLKDRVAQFERIITDYGGHCMQLYDRFIHQLPSYSFKDFSKQQGPYAFMTQTKSHYQHPVVRHMHKIQVATLLIHSWDDPVVSIRNIPWTAFISNKNIITATTRRGGHVGWYEGMLPFGQTLADRMIVDFVSAVLDSHSHTNFLMRMVTSCVRASGAGESAMLLRPASIARICSDSNFLVGQQEDGGRLLEVPLPREPDEDVE